MSEAVLGIWALCVKNLYRSVTVDHGYTLGRGACRVLMLGSALRHCIVFPDPSQETKVEVTEILTSGSLLQGLVFPDSNDYCFTL